MKKWAHSLERLVDRLIPYSLILLIFVVLIDLFYKDTAQKYSWLLGAIDVVVLIVFFTDLLFKYIRARNLPYFLKHYWLDIIAVFPFFLIFRIFEEIILFTKVGEELSSVQQVVHGGVEIERIVLTEEEARIIAEAEKAGKPSRLSLFLRYFEQFKKVPRMTKVFAFFERPTGEHHPYEK